MQSAYNRKLMLEACLTGTYIMMEKLSGNFSPMMEVNCIGELANLRDSFESTNFQQVYNWNSRFES